MTCTWGILSFVTVPCMLNNSLQIEPIFDLFLDLNST